jgi:thiamine-monophosphate kinase
MKISDLGEAKILDWIEKTFSLQKDKRLLVGPGDDAAVIKVSPDRVLVVTTDELVDKTHFINPLRFPGLIAGKLLRINLSDLAGMGNVKPVSCVIGAGLQRNIPFKWVQKFVKTISREAKSFGLSVCGGNLARSDTLHVYMTVIGQARADEIIARCGAKPGDLIYNIGCIGDSMAGLDIFKTGKKPVSKTYKRLLNRFWLPDPKLKEGRIIGRHKLASSLIDNSDGLLRSLEIISQKSGCRMNIKLSENCISKELKDYSMLTKNDWKKYAVPGGEDYGLIFTVPCRKVGKLKSLIPDAVFIGSVEKGSGVKIEDYEEEQKTFEHF